MLSQPQIGIPLSATVPTMYSESGQAVLDALLRSRPELVKQAGGMLGRAAPQAGAVLAPSAVFQYNTEERLPPELRLPLD